MNDALLMSMLDAAADGHKKTQPLGRRQIVLVAVLVDRQPVYGTGTLLNMVSITFSLVICSASAS